MYQWYYQAVGYPQYGTVVLAGYQDGRDGMNGMYLPFAQQSQLSLFSDPHNPSASAFNLQWNYRQPQFHYVGVAPSSPWPPMPIVQNHYPGSQHQSIQHPNSINQNPPIFDHPIRASPTPLSSPLAESNTVTGPPRKPKQSGYALWVGNIPQNTQLEEMKDFFAMEGIESIFFIRRSHCAFVNYSTQKVCEEAMAAFHLKGNPSSVPRG